MLQISQEKTNYAVEYILECCIVRGNVPKKEFSGFNIIDRNYIPILARAVEEALRKLGDFGKKRKDSGN